MAEVTDKYEYAGFIFLVSRDEEGKLVLTAAPGQHSAAYKDKHRRAAMSCYNEDHPVGAGMHLTLAERNFLP